MSSFKPVSVQRNLDSAYKETVQQTTCAYCGVGCGVDIQVRQEGKQQEIVALKGSVKHPANLGRLCVKGSQLASTVDDSIRLARPSINGRDASWEDATAAVAKGFSDIISEHGPDSVAFYVSGQLLTEDYYVANKLMKGYIGSANIDTNSRLCMSSAVAAHKRAFGADVVPCNYEDLELCDLLVFIGSNAAWTHPVLFQRVEKAKAENPNLKLVFIDPRKTASCESADLHLPIKAGTDVALFNGLLNYLASNDGLDQAYIEKHVDGFAATLETAGLWSLDRVAEVCDIDSREIEAFYQLFSSTEKAISFFSMGVNQSSSGVDKANSIINCHLATGKIGKEGSGPFSITGQPNAMGGREVGGLANLLAAHMDIDNSEHRALVQSYWDSPAIADKPGLKAVDLFERINEGKVKAVWIMATNPLVSMPNRNQVQAALEKCELVVVSDCVASNDTLQYADIKLPATGWSEKDGTVTNSERTISRQRGFLSPYGESRHDWQILCDVAQKMGFSGFDFQSPSDVFKEYAGLTAYKNDGRRSLDISRLADLSEDDYNALRPVQWPVNRANPRGTKRMFTDGVFFTPNQRANCIPTEYQAPEQAVSEAFPYVLNTGRLRDQWHTMTRTGVSAELSQHIDEAALAIHPKDAAELGLKEGSYVSLASSVEKHQSQQVLLPLKIDQGLRRRELFAPIHWGKEWASSSSIAHLFTDARDKLSGQPELKHAAVSLTPVEITQHIHVVSRSPLPKEWLQHHADVWTKIRIRDAFSYRIANTSARSSLADGFKHVFPSFDEAISHDDQSRKQLVLLLDGKIESACFVSDEPLNIERTWVESLVGADALSSEQVHGLVHAQIDAEFAQGRIVCSCFKVGENAIKDAITAQGCQTIDELGDKLKCGTNCGSCRSELRQILDSEGVQPLNLEPLETAV